jgi:hypothetical protein
METERIDKLIMRHEIEEQEYWRTWIEKIPLIKFPLDCLLKVIPPFGGAMARFVVIKGKREVSVYLDCFDRLGFMQVPYWEIYSITSMPYTEPQRFLMHDVDGLAGGISKMLGISE